MNLKKELSYIIWSIATLFIMWFIIFFKFYNNEYVIYPDIPNTWSDIINTWSDINSMWDKEKILISNQEWYLTKSLDNFPKVKFNNPVKDIKLIAEISFTDNFVKKYNYENSTWYFFALKFFVWNFDNWWYYNVYRKQNGAVWNDNKRWLVWAKLAYEIRDWVKWEIDLNYKVPIAVSADKWMPTYQVRYLNIEDYINNHIWEELPIWIYLSSVTEKQWREITKIKSLKLVYVWREADVEVISN